MATAVSTARGDALVTTRANGPSDSPTRRARATPSAERCEPRPRPASFLVSEWRRTSSQRMEATLRDGPRSGQGGGGVDDHLDGELAGVGAAQQVAVGGVLALAAGLVQVGPADVDQGEGGGQGIHGPQLGADADQALGAVGVGGA